MNVITDNVKRLAEGKQNISVCTTEGMCVLATGSTRLAKADLSGTNTPVAINYATQEWTLCEDKLVLTRTSKGEGSINDYNLNTTISLLKSPGIMPIAYKSIVDEKDRLDGVEAAPVVKGGHYIRLFVTVGGITPNINAAAPRPQEKYYDCNDKKWHDVTEQKYGISMANFAGLSSLREDKSEEGFLEVYQKPTLLEKDIVPFLLKPTSGKTFKLKGGQYTKQNNITTETIAEITLFF